MVRGRWSPSFRESVGSKRLKSPRVRYHCQNPVQSSLLADMEFN